MSRGRAISLTAAILTCPLRLMALHIAQDFSFLEPTCSFVSAMVEAIPAGETNHPVKNPAYGLNRQTPRERRRRAARASTLSSKGWRLSPIIW